MVGSWDSNPRPPPCQGKLALLMSIDFFCIRLTCLGLPKIRKSSSIERKIRTRYIFRYAFNPQLGSGSRQLVSLAYRRRRFHPITDQSQHGGLLIVDNLEYQEMITVCGNLEFGIVQSSC